VDAYTKITLEADTPSVRGFVRGWCTARGLSPQEQDRSILWPEEWGVRVTSFFSDIAEALRHGDVTVFLVASDLLPDLLAACAVWPESLRLRSAHAVAGAAFDFHFEIYDRDEATRVQEIFAALPAGVSVGANYAPEVDSHPETRAGMYAPAHSYVCRGRGKIEGDLRGVLEVHERCRQYERVRIEEVVLNLGAAITGGP